MAEVSHMGTLLTPGDDLEISPEAEGFPEEGGTSGLWSLSLGESFGHPPFHIHKTVAEMTHIIEPES